MKMDCRVIRDLLPLYVDEVCSAESREIVEEHLSECETCTKILDEMKTETISKEEVEMNLEEAESIRNLSRKWNRELWMATLRGIGSTILVIALIFLVVYIFVGIKRV